MLKPGQQMLVKLAGMQVGSVVFHAAVSDAVGTIVRQVSEAPWKYLAARGESLDAGGRRKLSDPQVSFVHCGHGDGAKSEAAAATSGLLDCTHGVATDGGASLL